MINVRAGEGGRPRRIERKSFSKNVTSMAWLEQKLTDEHAHCEYLRLHSSMLVRKILMEFKARDTWRGENDLQIGRKAAEFTPGSPLATNFNQMFGKQTSRNRTSWLKGIRNLMRLHLAQECAFPGEFHSLAVSRNVVEMCIIRAADGC